MTQPSTRKKMSRSPFRVVDGPAAAERAVAMPYVTAASHGQAPTRKPKLLDQVREAIRASHYADPKR